MPDFHMAAGAPDSGPHAYVAVAFTSGLSPQLLVFLEF